MSWGWIGTIIAAVIGVIGKFFKAKDDVVKIAEVKDEQTKAAMSRPDADGLNDRLRSGKF